MKITIIGTAGFIGMHLSHFLMIKGYAPQINIDYLKPIYGTELSEIRVSNLEKTA
jgi:malate/lactate dehydrogenase